MHASSRTHAECVRPAPDKLWKDPIDPYDVKGTVYEEGKWLPYLEECNQMSKTSWYGADRAVYYLNRPGIPQ